MAIFCLRGSAALFAQESDSTAIVHLLKSDYETMATFDLNAHISRCTKDYLLIENGEIWDLAKETEWYKSNVNRKLSRTDSFTFKSIKVFNDIAYAVYGLRSEITENNDVKIKTWNESAVFRKEEGQWKIALIHSTPVKQD